MGVCLLLLSQISRTALWCVIGREHMCVSVCVCVRAQSASVHVEVWDWHQVSSAALHFIFQGTVSHLTPECISLAMWACQLVPEVSSFRLECWHYTGYHSYLKSDPLCVKWVTHWAISLAHGSQILIPIYLRQMIIVLKIKISGTWKICLCSHLMCICSYLVVLATPSHLYYRFYVWVIVACI